jgi:hypothetical protein
MLSYTFCNKTPCSPSKTNNISKQYVSIVKKIVIRAETSVVFQRNTRRYMAQDGTVRNDRCKNLSPTEKEALYTERLKG